ncbi:unnamed protein product [Ceutorhynchus assimilis]|uniref:Uncharacterized protein n=1 Tax=Ceutorhynchus assimilis TaxID=467358 RepID=A0A9N9MIE8_9CUCU|nr:unnamed protein product [Ceutorhynchus assimilis]
MKKHHTNSYSKMFQSTLAIALLLGLAYQMVSTEKNSPGELFMRNVPMEKVEKCAEELGLIKEEVKMYLGTGNRVPVEKELCLHKCAATSVGAIKNGKMNLDYIKANFPPELENDMDKIVGCFEKIDSITVCQDMLQVQKCLKKN